MRTLLESMNMLSDVLLLLMWVFFVFGIVGINLFMGKLRYRYVSAGLEFYPKTLNPAHPEPSPRSS